MKLAFVDVKYKEIITLPDEFISQLPKKVMLFVNIQLMHQRDAIAAQLEKHNIEVLTSRPKHSWHDGQLLGCGNEKWDQGQEAFVYVGDGFFHPSALLFNNDEKVFQYDPKTGKIKVLDKDDMRQILGAKKGGMATFYSSKNIGVLITTKYGQQRMQPAFKLQEKFPDKTFYYLLGDTIDFSKLEDFPFIQCYINTACPRISDDHSKIPRPCINIEDVAELKMKW